MIHIGIIGCGDISTRNYVPNITSRFRNMEIYALCDLDLERAKALADRHGIAHVLTLDEIFQEPEIDVIVNLTNPHSMQLFVLNADPTVGADVHFLNTGVPHAVAFLDKLEGLDISRLGAYLRYHEAFSPKGTNANFARILSPGHIAIRTYERGVEDETLACGTGITACALLHAVLTDAPSPIQVDVAGGDTLKVGFQRTGDRFTDVTLTGPADLVFTGDIQI